MSEELRPKYRIWDKQEKKMWPEFNGEDGFFSQYILRADGNVVKTDFIPGEGIRCTMPDQSRFVIMPSLRVKDKNSKEIFEGDIISRMAGIYRKIIKALKWGTFDNGIYGYDLPSYSFSPEEYEVIGNIWENPELMEE